MTAQLKLRDDSFLRQVEEVSDTQISTCLQCHKCSAGCPIGPDTDLRSSQIMRLIQFSEPDDVLQSKGIWLCASCEACTSRCPMSIDVAGVMDACRIIAKQNNTPLADKNVDRFNTAFLKSVNRHGRAFEVGLMTGYGLRSGITFGEMGKAAKLFFRGRLRLTPANSGGRKQLQKVMKKTLKEEKEQ